MFHYSTLTANPIRVAMEELQLQDLQNMEAMNIKAEQGNYII